MSVSEIFVRRPVMTTLVMIGILVFGIAAYRLLPVSDLPNVDFPTIQVQANLPGASPETMASAVATVLEKQFSAIPSLESMTSRSGIGQTWPVFTIVGVCARTEKKLVHRMVNDFLSHAVPLASRLLVGIGSIGC